MFPEIAVKQPFEYEIGLTRMTLCGAILDEDAIAPVAASRSIVDLGYGTRRARLQI
jgi:hypothetical protein